MSIATLPLIEQVVHQSDASSQGGPLSADLLRRMHGYWRAANYLSVGQIYLRANPLLERSLTLADIKPRLLGHWGTTPGLNLVYVHLNRLIVEHNLGLKPNQRVERERLC